MTLPTLAYQSSNILENLYTDSVFTYIFTTTLTNSSHQFQAIINYCNTYIPTWKPTYNNPSNRIAYNSDYMFELVFYKNLILVIPLYMLSSSVTNFENAITQIRNYCLRLSAAEDGLDTTLNALVNYKMIFYSPIMLSNNFSLNLFKTKKTIIKTDLHTELYQSIPLALNSTSTITPTLPMTTNLPIYQNITPPVTVISNGTIGTTGYSNIMINNPLYTPYQSSSTRL